MSHRRWDESAFRRTRALDLSGSRTSRVFARSAVVQGSVLMDSGFCSSGGVSLEAAHITRDLDCREASLNSPDGFALDARGVQIGSSVLLGVREHENGERNVAYRFHA